MRVKSLSKEMLGCVCEFADEEEECGVDKAAESVFSQDNTGDNEAAADIVCNRVATEGTGGNSKIEGFSKTAGI